ncbi:hypothetical protein L1887_14738 [Cichorium endivia]|nr:hypothetical protein L1887_14738 [Cichorium endivia]
MKGNQKENKNSSQSKSQPFKDKGVRDPNVSFADIVCGEKRETHVRERCMKEEEMNEKQSESFEAKKSHFKKEDKGNHGIKDEEEEEGDRDSVEDDEEEGEIFGS